MFTSYSNHDIINGNILISIATILYTIKLYAYHVSPLVLGCISSAVGACYLSH